MMGVIVLCGLIARAILPIANDPHIVLPYFYIGVPHEGISPEDSERLLIQPMEIELRKIEGVKEIKSQASEGYATLFVEFEASVDLGDGARGCARGRGPRQIRDPVHGGRAGRARARRR
jgi:multidrug efflux pump